MSSTPVVNICALGFFTFLLFWTLNGESGRDMNDVVVEYWDARVEVQDDTE